MNRPRKKDECYRCYRRHLKEEDKIHKEKMKWRTVWTSVIIIPDANKSDLPAYLRPLVKVRVRGTFNRYLGHSMPNSLYEKHKRERVYQKMKQKGIISNEA